MKFRAYILVVVFLVLFMGKQAQAGSASNPEYQIKAAFLYNFIKFIDWPEEKVPDSNEPIIIGIIGKDPFRDAFEPIKDRTVKGKKVIVERFKGLEELKKLYGNNQSGLDQQIEAIRKCHLLFVCSSENQELKETINLVKDHSVLTVADMKGFLKSGGTINFVMKTEKVRFEINVAAAKRAKLKIRSQLLRLAEKIVEEKPSQKAEN